MKFTGKRLLAAGAIGISAIVTPLALTVGLPAVGSGVGSVASAAAATCTPATAGNDAICYVQSATSPPDTYQYDNGVAPTPQTANISGNCATVTGGAAALLNVCGFVYPSNTYSGGSNPAPLGTNGTATGVGAVSPAWTLDNKLSGQKQQAEAIDFSPGPAAVVNNRPFSDAQIQVQRKDTGVAQNPALNVQLVEFDSAGNVLASQNCTITGNTGTQITADTNGPGTGGNCAGPAPGPFNRVEVRDTTTSTSISVVNTSTFTLLNQVCGGHSVTATDNGGGVQASLSLQVGAGCKGYTSFSSIIQGGQPTVAFLGFSNSPVQFTVQITWPLVPLCQPYADPNIPPDLAHPVCAVHQVSFDNVTYYDEVYCQAGNPSPPAGEPQAGLCTSNKQYNNDSVSTDPNTGVVTTTPLLLNGQPATQIVETWVGYIDWWGR